LNDPGRDDGTTSNDDAVWDALGRIRQSNEMPSCQQHLNVDTAIEQLRGALLRPEIPKPHGASIRSSTRALLLRLVGRSEGTEACLEWLRHTGRFTETEIATMRRIKIFIEQNNGQVILRRDALSLLTATAGIAFLSFVAGGLVVWITVDTHLGVSTIFTVWLLGWVIGSIAGLLFQRSFGFVRIRDKILQLAPWL